MKTLYFNVNEQHIEARGNPEVVSGTKNYLIASFGFDGTWDGFKKIAIFNNKYYVQIQNNKCSIPEEVTKLKVFSVKVAGQRDDTRIITDFAVVKQR